MTFDCHGQPIILPADLDGVFTQPPTFIHLHEVMEQLDPALKEIVTIVRQEGPTKYLGTYNADFIIRDYIIFISRKAHSGKSYWECYVDGPRKYPFAHWVLICFMAYLKRPETKKKLQQRRQAIDTQLKADHRQILARAQAEEASRPAKTKVLIKLGDLTFAREVSQPDDDRPYVLRADPVTKSDDDRPYVLVPD